MDRSNRRRKATGGGKQRTGRQPAPSRRSSDPHGGVLYLQRTAGNRATTELLGAGGEADLKQPAGGVARSAQSSAARDDAALVQRADPPAAAPPPNFDELEQAYHDARAKERTLYKMRTIGATEVRENLDEADAPSIGDIILKAAIMGALGYASGGISQAITGRILAEGASQTLQTAVQSGIDDAMKDAVPAVVDLALAKRQVSRSSYFAAIEAGIAALEEKAVLKLNAAERKAKEDARRDPATLPVALKEVLGRQKIIDGLKDTAQTIQYRESLSQWMVAMAQAELGAGDAGTEMQNMPGHGEDPSRIFHQTATAGVLRLSFGMKSARRPLSINWGTVSGLNDATKERLKDTKIRDLRIPIFAQGWIFDGFWDGLEKGDNEVTMSRNEAGTVFVNYGPDAEDAMKGGQFANGKAEVVDIARDVIENDIGEKTLGSVKGLY